MTLNQHCAWIRLRGPVKHLTRKIADSGYSKRQRCHPIIRQQQYRAADAAGEDNEQIVPGKRCSDETISILAR